MGTKNDFICNVERHLSTSSLKQGFECTWVVGFKLKEAILAGE